MIRKKASIEFVFLLFTSVVMLTLIGIGINRIIYSYNFNKTHLNDHFGIDWQGMVIVLLAVMLVYAGFIFIWACGLWKTFKETGRRYPIQLVLFFVVGIFPFLHLGLDLFLRQVAAIEHPFTAGLSEFIAKVFWFPVVRKW